MNGEYGTFPNVHVYLLHLFHWSDVTELRNPILPNTQEFVEKYIQRSDKEATTSVHLCWRNTSDH